MSEIRMPKKLYFDWEDRQMYPHNAGHWCSYGETERLITQMREDHAKEMAHAQEVTLMAGVRASDFESKLKDAREDLEHSSQMVQKQALVVSNLETRLKEVEKQLFESQEKERKAGARAAYIEFRLEGAEADNERLTRERSSLSAEEAEAGEARLHHRYRTIIEDLEADILRLKADLIALERGGES